MIINNCWLETRTEMYIILRALHCKAHAFIFISSLLWIQASLFERNVQAASNSVISGGGSGYLSSECFPAPVLDVCVSTITSLGQVLILACKWRLIFLCILAWTKGFKQINSVTYTLNQIEFKAPATAFQLASQSMRHRPRCSPGQFRTLVTAQEQTAQSLCMRPEKPKAVWLHVSWHGNITVITAGLHFLQLCYVFIFLL